MSYQGMPTSLVERTVAPATALSANIATFTRNMDLREAARLLGRRMQLVLGVTLSGVVLALLIALMLTPQYRAETVVMLDPRQTKVVELGNVVSGLPAENAALRSEMDIIMSRSIIDRVINKLELLNDNELNPPDLATLLNPLNWFRKPEPSQEEATRMRSKIAENMHNRLHVNNDGHSFSIAIAFDSKSPAKASKIANAFADEYLVDQLETKYEATARANKWLDERLGALKEKVEASEKAVEQFRQKTKLIDVGGSTVAAKQLTEVNTQLTLARGETSKAEARLRSLQGSMSSKEGVLATADVLTSPLIQNLRQQEAQVRSREAELASRYGELHPKIINARAERRELQSKITEEVNKISQSLENEVVAARAKEHQMEEELHKLEDRAGVEMKDSVTLRQMERESEANRTLYESFLNRFKQTSEQKDLQTPDARIIARADPPIEPAFPLKWLFMLVGGILGGGLGVLVAYLVEYFDRGFRSVSQLEEISGLPVIGIVPSLAKISSRSVEDYVVDKPHSAYSEALRTVRTAIHFSNVDNPPKTIMVTSAMPREGKTSFCLSMGRALAKGGNRILVIDADLRRPRIAEVLGLPKKGGGLSALLSGARKLEEVIQHDPIIKRLDIIPAYGKTPNAQDLLGSQQMKKMLNELAPKYDLVIIDTPPIMAVSDAAMVARAVDSTLFLVKWASTPRDTAAQALKQLNTFGCKVAGVVMSQVDTAEHAKYGEGYYHQNYAEYYSN
jgi:polysaccharide biosynthesis transport protein